MIEIEKINKDDKFSSLITYSLPGDFAPSLMESPIFIKEEHRDKDIDSCVRYIYLQAIENFFKMLKAAKAETGRLMAGLKYFHDKDLTTKEICAYVVKIYPDLIQPAMNTIRLPARLEYISVGNQIYDYAKNYSL